jgi:hypothetical protein
MGQEDQKQKQKQKQTQKRVASLDLWGPQQNGGQPQGSPAFFFVR